MLFQNNQKKKQSALTGFALFFGAILHYITVALTDFNLSQSKFYFAPVGIYVGVSNKKLTVEPDK